VKKLVNENSRRRHRVAIQAPYTAFMVKLGHTKRAIRVLLVGLAGQHVSELEAILGSRRPRIIQAETCVDGWKRLHESTFDVLIVHETAEGGGWRDLVAEVADMRLALPVVLASAKPDERLWVDALSAGAYDVLEVPFHPAETSRVLLTAARQRNHAASCARRRSSLGGLRRAAALAAPPAGSPALAALSA
jgi:DNA-binding NtrC family response regulator